MPSGSHSEPGRVEPVSPDDTHGRQPGSPSIAGNRIGLGLAALGRPAYITLGRGDDLGAHRSVEALEQRCHEVLDAAYASGIRYIDAARSYGLAEAFVRSWLRRRTAPDAADADVDVDVDVGADVAVDVVIASKWGYAYVGDWRMDAPAQEVKDLSVETLRRQITESRALLGHRLAIYQIHSATLESGVLDDLDVLRELARLRSEGLVIGLTVTGPKQADVIRRALQTTIDGVNPFEVVQATWNLLEPSAGPALAEAKAGGWRIVIKEALANGRLTERGREPDITQLAGEARARETTIDALALAAALSQPWADVVLSGAVTPEQLASNVKALALLRDAADWPVIAEAAPDYWSARSKLTWQ